MANLSPPRRGGNIKTRFLDSLLGEIFQEDENIVAILYQIRSAYNVGSMIRTADCAGIRKVYFSGYTASPDDSERAKNQIAKTALGAEKSVEWEKAARIKRLIKFLKNKGFQIIALETGGENIFEFKPKGKVAFIVGNEVKGLPKGILDLADNILTIPMKGKKESLNVAVAFGIAAYWFSKM